MNEKELEKEKLNKASEKITDTFKGMFDDLKSSMKTDKEEIEKKFEEINSNIEASNNEKNVLKVFVDADTKKDIKELDEEEVVKSYSLALFRADEEALKGFQQREIDKMTGLAKAKALSEGTPADGGFLVPQEFYNRLVVERDKDISMRSKVTVIPVTTNTLTIPKHETGPEVYWTSEGATKTTTTMDFSQPTITVYKLAAIIYMTDELMEDAAFNLTDVIINRFAVKMNEAVERAIIAGTGVGQPTGIFVNAVVVAAAVACVGNLGFDQLIDLVYTLPAKYRKGAEWIIHNNNVRELRKLKDNDGRYLWQDPVAVGQPPTLLGYPVYETYDCGEDEIAFGDYKEAYWLTDRHQMRVKITNDTETTFTQDKTAIRVVERLGGDVVVTNAVRILNTIP